MSIALLCRPVLTAAQARARDRFTIDVVGVPGLVLMEHAGRAVADVIEQRYTSGRVVVVCGGGNNGGDGFVCARHLLCRGRDVEVLLTAPSSLLRGDAATAYALLQAAVTALGRGVVRAFEQRDIGAHVGKQHAAKWPGADTGEFHNFDAGQGAGVFFGGAYLHAIDLNTF